MRSGLGQGLADVRRKLNVNGESLGEMMKYSLA